MSKPSYEELEAQVKQLAAERDAVVAENAVILNLARIFADRADEYKSSMFGYSVFDSFNELKCAGSKEFADAYAASLRAEGVANAIPEGYVLMPKQIHLDADAVECICSQGGDGGYNYGDFTDVVLWVGEVEDDDGSKTHGLNVSSADYPEEGSINLCEFAAQLRSQSEQVKGVQS